MSARPATNLRRLAATLTCLSGLALIAGLWLRELTGMVVVDAVVGAIYLILALGLLGTSRFSLFMGIFIPLAVAAALWFMPNETVPLRDQQLAGNGLIATLCVLALWRVRHIASN